MTERANSGLACLSLLLGFHQIPSDVGQLHHAAGASGEIDSATLVRLARKLGARASQRRIAIDKLPSAPLPCIARGRDGEFFILASIRDGQALIQPADGPPQTLSAGELADLWDGEAVLITTRAASGGAAAFDVTWFIPALVKYRGLIGEVLAASFVLQLFALAAPLVFQVVIDKVLVHQGLTTLNGFQKTRSCSPPKLKAPRHTSMLASQRPLAFLAFHWSPTTTTTIILERLGAASRGASSVRRSAPRRWVFQ